DTEIGRWIGAMGIKLSSKLIDIQAGQTVRKTTPQVCQNIVTRLACNIIKKENAGRVTENGTLVSQPNKHGEVDKKRDRVRVYKVNTKATKVVNDKPQASKSEAWRLIRDGILTFLHIRLNDGVWEYDTDSQFKIKDLRETQWYHWACENKDAINAADLGAKIKGDAPSDRALACWIRKMGIKLSSRQIDAHKLDGDTTQENCGKKATEKRRQIRVYQVNIAAMTPLTETLTRRYKAGEMPWEKIAQTQLDQNALDQIHDEYAQNRASPEPVKNDATAILKLLATLKLLDDSDDNTYYSMDWIAMILNIPRINISTVAENHPEMQVLHNDRDKHNDFVRLRHKVIINNDGGQPNTAQPN
ncbi:MAG: hypothetical protein ABFS56_34795, partial [Pseudomonadota bacterium]